MRFLVPAMVAALAAAVGWPLAAAPPPDAASPHPVADRLIRVGVPVDGQSLRLKPPLVRPGMTAAEQRKAVTRLVGKTRMKQFLRDSVVARFELETPTIAKLPDGVTARGLDLAFVVHADLEAIRGQEFGGAPAASAEQGAEGTDFESYFEPLDGRRPAAGDEAVEWAKQPRLYRYRFPVLEKVVVSGLLRAQAVVVDDRVVVQTIVSPADRLADAANPTVWRAIPRGAKSDDELAPPQPFGGMVGYLQATKLKFQPAAALVEVHAFYFEPEGWFGGRNLLASKLPLAMQDSVRRLRRELKKPRTKP